MPSRAELIRSRPALLSAPLALAILALSACGSGRSGNGLATASPARVLAAAEAAAASAASVRVAGSIVSAGRPISVNMELVPGKGGRGVIVFDGLRLDLLDVDRAVYIRGNQALYRRLAGPLAARLQGRWLKASPGSGAYASLSSLTDPSQLVGTVLAEHGPLTRSQGRRISGQPTVAVSDRAADGTLYVAATGIPYPLQIRRRGSAPARLTFDRWDLPVTLISPSDATNIKSLQRVP